MKFDRPTRLRLAFAALAIGFLIAGAMSGDIASVVPTVIIVLASYGVGMYAYRRGSTWGAEFVGHGDERSDLVTKDAALGTVYSMVAAAILYGLYCTATNRSDERFAPVIAFFVGVWFANYLVALWRARGSGTALLSRQR